MAGRIEEGAGRPIHEVLVREASISEYYLYGVHIEHGAPLGHVTPRAFPLCRTFWSDVPRAEEAERVAAGLKPDHVAVALQSTRSLSLADRAALYSGIERALAHKAPTGR